MSSTLAGAVLGRPAFLIMTAGEALQTHHTVSSRVTDSIRSQPPLDTLSRWSNRANPISALPDRKAWNEAELLAPALYVGICVATERRVQNEDSANPGDVTWALGNALTVSGLESYYDSELNVFLVRGYSLISLSIRIQVATEVLLETPIGLEGDKLSGIILSFGIGRDLAAAEEALRIDQDGRKLRTQDYHRDPVNMRRAAWKEAQDDRTLSHACS